MATEWQARSGAEIYNREADDRQQTPNTQKSRAHESNQIIEQKPNQGNEEKRLGSPPSFPLFSYVKSFPEPVDANDRQ